jgi:hypothetical protein
VTVVGVATYVGDASLEESMLPLIVQALTDPEETVIERVVRSFLAIAQLGLFQRSTLWELVEIVVRFTIHPNGWIQEAAAYFICFCVDRRRHWLLLGTSHGVLDLWSLGFHMRIKAVGFPGDAPLYHISLVPSQRSRQLCVAITGGIDQGEITIWDLEETLCIQVYHTDNPTAKAPKASEPYRLLEIDEERSGGMLSRFASTSESAIDGGIRGLTSGMNLWENSDPRFYFFSVNQAGLEGQVLR